MQFRVVSADVAAAGPAGGKTNGGGGGGSGASSQQAALWRELRRQARDITAQSLPMLLPAAMFVMQQASGACVFGCLGGLDGGAAGSSCLQAPRAYRLPASVDLALARFLRPMAPAPTTHLATCCALWRRCC